MPAIVTFTVDPYRIVEISVGGDNEIDWQEIYSEWKVWVKANPGHPKAMSYEGAAVIDPSTGQQTGVTHFLHGPWKFRPAELSHRLRINGNCFSADPPGEPTVVPTLGTYTVLVEQFVSNLVDASVAKLDLAQLQESVYLDTVDGDDGGEGTPTDPVKTLAQAFTVAQENNLYSLSIKGDVVMDRDVSGWAFNGTIGAVQASMDINSRDLSGCVFNKITLSGNAAGSRVCADQCVLDGLYYATGEFTHCGLVDVQTPGVGVKTILVDCFDNSAGGTSPVIDMVLGQADELQVRGYQGELTIKNVDQPTERVSIDLMPGHLVLDSSCVDGVVSLRGVGKLTDQSGGTLALDKLGFQGMPYDDPHNMGWQYEMIRRAMLEAFAAKIDI